MLGYQQPRIINSGARGDGSIVISHSEYMGEVTTHPTTPGVFAVASYNINPGNAKTFPWLAQVACNFQEYSIEGMAFHFKSMSADALNSTNTALGTVIMATQYDPTAANPQSKQEMENCEFAQSTKPSISMTHFIETSKRQTPLSNLYVLPDGVTATGDERFYNFAQFNIATQGGQAANINLGELWVSYTIKLYKPQLYDALGKDVQWFSFNIQNGNATTCASSTYPLGQVDMSKPTVVTAGASFNPKSTFYPTAHNINNGNILLPGITTPKSYFVNIAWGSTVTATFTLGVFTSINCELSNSVFFGGGTVTLGPQNNLINTTQCQMSFVLNVDAQSATGKDFGFMWNQNPTIPALSGMTINIMEIPLSK